MSTVFDGFQHFSIVFNGLSLHEVNTQGVKWSVIGEVFYYFCFIFFVFHKPTTGSPGYWVFASLPPTV